MGRFVVRLETECRAVYFSQFGKTIIVVVVSLAVTHHAEQVDSGIPLIVDDGPVEGGHVVKTFPVNGGKSVSNLKKIVQGFFRDDVDCSGDGV